MTLILKSSTLGSLIHGQDSDFLSWEKIRYDIQTIGEKVFHKRSPSLFVIATLQRFCNSTDLKATIQSSQPEIIPAKRHFETESTTIYIEKISNVDEAKSFAPAAAPVKTVNISSSDLFLTFVILCLGICLYSDQYLPNIFPISHFCAQIEVYLDELPAFRGRGLFHRKGTVRVIHMLLVLYIATIRVI